MNITRRSASLVAALALVAPVTAVTATHADAATAPTSTSATKYCPWTTSGVTDTLNVRSGPGTQYRVVDHWNPGTTRLIPTPITVTNGFLYISSGHWASRSYVKPTGGLCAQ